MNVQTFAIGLVVLLTGTTLADDPSRDPRYKEFREAGCVVLAKRDAAKVAFVQESFPPRYILRLL